MNKALSLLELSIVLVVVGLLISAVSSGSKLVHQAKLNSLIKDVGKYTESVNNFKQIYKYLPGDMVGAYELWGASCGATKHKCDGDGDGKVESLGANDDDNEYNRVFHHLSLAEILSGFIDTTHGTSTIDLDGEICNEGYGATDPGVNSPEFALRGGSLALTYVKKSKKHKWVIGQGPRCAHPLYSLFTPKGAEIIDKKLDDGIYDQGKILIFNGKSSGSQATDCIISPQ